MTEGDPIEAERVRAEVRHRLFGGERPVLRVGRFEVGARLGIGAMGVVYEGHDRELSRTVAIKLLLDRVPADDLRREAQALAKLRHPNVVSVYEIGTWQELPFVAMEHVDGMTLRAWLAERKRPWQQIVAVFAGAGRGLAAAHAAGLVHRDFKLDNVLVDREGQARVVDFGLARKVESSRGSIVRGNATATGTPTNIADYSLASASTSMAGNIAGTPAYMAPEVLQTQPATARSDQFSFGVSLHEALTGTRPFVELAVAPQIAAIRAQAHPRVPEIPRSLQAAIDRCLAFDPAQRFPDVGTVVAALEPRARRVHPAVVLAAGALPPVMAATIYFATREPDRAPVADPCEDAGAAILSAWNPEQHRVVAAAFEQTKAVFASDATSRAIAMLDDYAQRWAASARATCRATHQRSEPEPTLALRTTCLDDRRRQLAALAAQYTSATPKTVERAVAAAAALPSVESCNDTSGLADRTPPPQAADAAAQLASLRDKLATARAQFHAGNAMNAFAAATALAPEVDKLAYAPLTAETQLVLGMAAAGSGELDAAGTALERAYREGLAGRHDPAAAEAAIKLAHVHGHVRAKPDEGRRWLADADTMLRRIGGAHELAAALHNVTGNLEQSAGNYDLALAAFARSEAAWRAAPGDHRIDVGGALHNAGNALGLQGHSKDAEPKLRDARAMWTEALGEHHPLVAMATTNLTGVMRDLGKYDDALALDETVLANERRRAGDDHPDVAFAHGAVANDLRGLARYTEALEHYVASRAIFAGKLGPEHPTVASSDHNIGAVYLALGKYDDAATHLTAALALKQKRGDQHPSLISTLDSLGNLALRRGRAADAKRAFARSLAIGEAVLGKDSPDLADAIAGLGEAALLGRDARAARNHLERALALRERSGSAVDLAAIRFPLGRARYELGERADGRALVEAAVGAFDAAHAYDRDAATAWLAAHPAE